MKILAKDGLVPFMSASLVEKFLKKAESELKETAETKKSSLTELRDLALSERDLSCRTSDDFLLKFLRARKFNTSKALQLLKKYMSFKRRNRDIFTGMSYDVLARLIRNKTFGFLPYRCEDGCAVFVVHLDNWNPSEFGIKDICRAIVMFLYHSVCDPVTQINGYKVIFDVKSHGFKHVRFCTPGNLYLLYSGTQECFPGRFKGIHIMNMSRAFQIAWAFINPFLSEKLKKRIIFHEDYSTLQDHFPESIIPVEFGGMLKDYDTIPWLKDAMSEQNLANVAN